MKRTLAQIREEIAAQRERDLLLNPPDNDVAAARRFLVLDQMVLETRKEVNETE